MSTFTETEQQILFQAWALHARDRGFSPQPWDLPECESLRKRGWLERQMRDGVGTYWWTREAEMALEMNALTDSVKNRTN